MNTTPTFCHHCGKQIVFNTTWPNRKNSHWAHVILVFNGTAHTLENALMEQRCQDGRNWATPKRITTQQIWPELNGERLSWSIGSYHTHAEQSAGFPKMRAVIRAMIAHRPDILHEERRQLVKSSLCDRLFGHNAEIALRVIDEELAR